MKKITLFTAMVVIGITAMCQTNNIKSPVISARDTVPAIPTLTITLPLDKWNPVWDIIMKTNVPTQQFLEAYKNVGAVIEMKIAEYNASMQPKK